MLDKDRIIIVCTVGVDGLPVQQANYLVEHVALHMRQSFDDSVKTFTVYDRSSKSIKVDMLNIKDCPQEKLDELQKTYDTILEEIKKSYDFLNGGI